VRPDRGCRAWINTGNSCIVDPNGQVIAGPVEAKEELIVAEVDLHAVTAAKRMFDAAGHYARPDVFTFEVNRKENKR
jgi:nitrilase